MNYKPWEEIVILESIQYTLENLLTVQGLGIPEGQLGRHLLWSEGVAFIHKAMPSTQEDIDKKRVRWSSVEWALMPEFSAFEEALETNVRIPIVNVNTNENLSEVAKWLRRSAKQI